jgi:CRP/FNR family nitrogen fixation transcriptional regulator
MARAVHVDEWRWVVDEGETEFNNIGLRVHQGCAVLDRVNSEKSTKSVSSQRNELTRQDALWSEFKYRGGSKLFEEKEAANHVYQIREGAVRTYKLLSEGRRQIAAFHLPGDLFGIANCELHQFSAEAIVNTTVWIAKRRSLFAALAHNDIAAANNIRQLVTRTLEHVENHLLLLGRQRAFEKVAAFLIEMDRRLDQPEVMLLPMGRRDIADYLVLTLETVSRALSIMQDEGILTFVGQAHRKMVLHDRSGLAQRATSSAGSRTCLQSE